MRTTIKNLALAAALGMGLALSAPTLAQSGKPDAGKQGDQPKQGEPGKVDIAKAVKKDLVIFRSGRQIEGVILGETPTELKFLVIVGTLKSEATYAKSDILEIKKDAFKADEAKTDDKDAGEKKAGEEKTGEEKTGDQPVGDAAPGTVDLKGKPIPADALKVYFVTFAGEFGRDLSQTPLKEIVDDMVAAQPDIVVVQFNHSFSLYGEENPDFVEDADQAFAMLDKARELDTLLSNRLRDDPALKNKRPRMVAWIKKAMGTAAFLPFTFPEIYFTSDANMGGIGGLESLRKMGDLVVQEKMRGIVLGRAIGLAEKGGHDGRIIRAMTRGEYILSYRMVNGKVEFLERMPESPDEILLKDDGPVNRDRTDILQDVIRMRGNDYMTLNAKAAFDIGFSRGTADTLDDLMVLLGVTRNYAVVRSPAPKILSKWSREVQRAETDVRRLIRQYQAVEVKEPGGFKERTAARSQRKALLRQIQSVADRYREAINPRAVGDVDGLISQMNIIINRIDQEQRLDRPDAP